MTDPFGFRLTETYNTPESAPLALMATAQDSRQGGDEHFSVTSQIQVQNNLMLELRVRDPDEVIGTPPGLGLPRQAIPFDQPLPVAPPQFPALMGLPGYEGGPPLETSIGTPMRTAFDYIEGTTPPQMLGRPSQIEELLGRPSRPEAICVV